MNRILSGNLKNVDKILGKNIIMTYNYEGTRGKKSLRNYSRVVNALFCKYKAYAIHTDFTVRI